MPVERTIIEWLIVGESREEIRSAVLLKWAEEMCGSADAYQRYRYNVEALRDGSRIYLHRPDWKNKGCDFEVWCENKIQRDDGKLQGRPSHTDLCNEIRAIAIAHPNLVAAIRSAIQRVWNSENADGVCNEFLPQLQDDAWRMRDERALKTAKWLFIEQDITDWNTSGRQMLLNGIYATLDGI